MTQERYEDLTKAYEDLKQLLDAAIALTAERIQEIDR